ncbi:MAG: hypothetical protein OEP95_11165 [Myxococcales bacterium]|nr:hypothetical protein [Myxococcales bacterium]
MLRCTRLLCLSLFFVATSASADPASLDGNSAFASLEPARLPSLSPTLSERARSLWHDSQRLEDADDFVAAAEMRVRVAELRPTDTHVRWRIARDLLHAARRMPAADHDARLQSFEGARRWAHEGLELDPHCGECCLYEFAATAQLATEGGLASSVGHVRDSGALLERCLEIPPTWSEPRWGAESGQLYYGAAAFFRMLPEGAWARWVLGMRGNPERAVDLARRATQISPDAAAFRVELGAALLCHASRTASPDAGAEGRRVLTEVQTRAIETPDSVRAAGLLAEPDHACDDSAHYGRVSWR